MNDDAIRTIFVKHSMEKSPDLELFDTDAIIKELALSAKAEIQKQVTLGKMEIVERLYNKTPPENGMSDVIGDCLTELQDELTEKRR